MTNQLRTGFTVNGNACPDHDRLVAWVASARPTTMLVMDNRPLAVELYEVAQGETKVGHRQYDPAEGAEWKTKTPAQYVSEVTAGLDPRIYVQVLNEPAINAADLLLLLYWLMGVMDELFNRGYKGIIGNFPMGQITQAHVEDGLFDNFLKHYHQYRGWHVIGIHEYTAVVRYFGVGQWPYYAMTPTEYFLNTLLQDMSYWPTREDLPCAPLPDGGLPPYWHVRRADWLTIQWIGMGGTEAPEYWVTESGYDNMQDVSEVFPALVNKWGIAPNYDNLRGFNSLANIWGAYWGNEWTFDMAAFEQEKWLHEECYPENYIGWNNFMWTSDSWRRDGFDMSQNLQFQSLLIDYAVELRTPPGPDPEPDPEPIPPELEQLFEFENKAEILVFLQANPSLVPLLIEIHSHIQDYFNAPCCRLEYDYDYDYPELQYIIVSIPTSLGLDEAMELDRQFNYEWWFNNPGFAEHKILIDLDWSSPPSDELPHPLWKGILGGVVLFLVFFFLIFFGILFLAHAQSIQALNAGGITMDQTLIEIWNGLSAIPIFAAIGFGVPTIYYLIEIWKRFLDPRIPTPDNKWLAFFLKPTPVGLFVFLVFVMAGSYYLAGTYSQEDAFRTVIEWVNTFFDAFGKLLLPAVVVQTVGSKWYNSNRAAGVAGFNAPSVTR